MGACLLADGRYGSRGLSEQGENTASLIDAYKYDTAAAGHIVLVRFYWEAKTVQFIVLDFRNLIKSLQQNLK